MLIGNKAFWVGAVASAVFLAVFVLLFVDMDTISNVLNDADYAYVMPSLLFYFLAVWFRTARWKFLLRPIIGKPKKNIYSVVIVGYMANNLIPIRIGEVIRAYYLSLREGCSTSAVFGTVAVERATDVLALLFFLGAAGLMSASGVERAFGDISSNVPGGTLVMVLAALLPFIAVFSVVLLISVSSKHNINVFLSRILIVVGHKYRKRILAIIDRLLEGLTVVNSISDLLKVLAWSIPVWAAEAAMYYLIAMGFDLGSIFTTELEFLSAILLFTAAANLAGVFPSTAGGWGPFDFFGAASLTALGVQNEIAAGYALTVHVVVWVPPTLVGALLLVWDGTSLSGLLQGAKKSRQSAADQGSTK